MMRLIPPYRGITAELYAGVNLDLRLMQELVLGIGRMAAAERAGIELKSVI